MKYKYKFFGLVYPERVKFELSGLENRYGQISISIPDWKINGSFSLEVKNCKIKSIFESDIKFDQNTEPNIETLKNYIEETIRTFVDTFCFVNSYNYDISIDKVICKQILLEYDFPVIGEWNHRAKHDDFLKIMDGVMRLQGKSNAISLAFADYRRSIKYPRTTALYCLRALETIRRAYFDDYSIKDDNKRDKTGWEKMASSLSVDKNQDLINFSKDNRHGNYPLITYEKRKEFMEYTRNALEKFIEWSKNNL